MKKSLVIALALCFVLAIAGTAFAAANPFVDVPAKHWAYDAVAKLAKAGIVDGYGDGTFRGDKNISRYEMAQIVAKAMARSDKADAANKALIDKLAVEFAAELNNLGVRVAKLEKNASTIKFSGDARLRWQDNFTLLPEGQGIDRFEERVRLYMSASVADNVNFAARTVVQNRIRDYSTGMNDQMEFDRIAFTFKNVAPLADVTVGRQNMQFGNGAVIGMDYFDGVKVTFGNTLKGFVAYGDHRFALGPSRDFTNLTVNKTDSILGLEYPVNDQFTVYAGYQNSNTASYLYKVWSLGSKVTLNDFTWKIDYAKNTHEGMDTNNTAYWTELYYKGANKNVVGSWGIKVDYKKYGENAVDVSGTAGTLDFGNSLQNFKGFGYGFDYTIAKNAVFKATVENLKDFAGGKYDQAIYIQTNFSF